MDRSPDDLGPRMRMADALVDQGCYQEAVEILEAAQTSFPRSAELSGKLRDTRSLVTEQTYIEGLTQAAESAKLTRNQLRCTKLGDVTACEDALRSKPDDAGLLLAKGDALIQAGRAADAVTAYRHALQVKPGDDAVKSKLAGAEALVAKSQPAGQPGTGGAGAGTVAGATPGVGATPGAGATPSVGATPGVGATQGAGATTLASAAGAGLARGAGSAGAGGAAARSARRAALAANTTSANGPASAAPTGQPNGGQRLTATPTTAVAALAPQENKTYSNEAPPGQTN